MKYNDKTTGFTHAIVRLCYFLLGLSAVAFPFMMNAREGSWYYFGLTAVFGKYLIIPFYMVVPAGFAALVCLDKMLGNIQKDIAFDNKNVKLLDIVTYCCVYAFAVGVISFIVIATVKYKIASLFLLCCGEAFMALIVRVVRNMLKKAIAIKEENDLVV